MRTKLLLVMGLALMAVPIAAPQSTANSLPNILVVMVDDQPKGTQDAMPVLRNRIASNGVTFSNGVAPTALCCPSRSSFLTGNHSHTTKVYTNEPTQGSWVKFHNQGAESDTLATRLDSLGYNTGLYGKYLNGFQRFREPGFTPPGWDAFRAILPSAGGDGSYYQYRLTGVDEYYGTAPADYSTDVVGQMAVNHIANTPADTPWFVYYAPYGPHAPMNPAPRHKNTWPLEPESAIPALNEKDVSDKPRWVKNKHKVDSLFQRRSLTRQHETLKSIDEWLGKLLDAADLSNTVVIYLSDNGYMLGAHRLTGKDVPYHRATEVPMYVRWDGVTAPGTTSSRITPQIDLTALIADAVNVDWQMEGKNALTTDRNGVVLEQTKNTVTTHPPYCGYRTERFLFVEYDHDKGREFYDYSRDPNELNNSIGKDRYRDKISAMRRAAIANCSPVPAGFNWN